MSVVIELSGAPPAWVFPVPPADGRLAVPQPASRTPAASTAPQASNAGAIVTRVIRIVCLLGLEVGLSSAERVKPRLAAQPDGHIAARSEPDRHFRGTPPP